MKKHINAVAKTVERAMELGMDGAWLAALRGKFALYMTNFDGNIDDDLLHLARRLATFVLHDCQGQVNIVREDKDSFRRQVPEWEMDVTCRFLAVVGGFSNEIDSGRVMYSARFMAQLGVQYILERMWRRADCFRAEVEGGQLFHCEELFRLYHKKNKPRSKRATFIAA